MKDASLGYILLESFCAVFHKFLWKGHETAKVNTFLLTLLFGAVYISGAGRSGPLLGANLPDAGAV
jgi:hypothetical protein